jgi:hypothetical protein
MKRNGPPPIYTPEKNILNGLTDEEKFSDALTTLGYSSIHSSLKPNMTSTTKYLTKHVTISGERVDSQDLNNFIVSYNLDSRDQYDEMSGSSLYLRLPDLKFKEGYKGRWNNNIFINLINEYRMQTDSSDIVLHRGNRDILFYLKNYNDPTGVLHDNEIGNRPSLNTYSNQIKGEEISYTFPWPWSPSYYQDRSRSSNNNSFPIYAFGDSVTLKQIFSFNINPENLISCVNDEGERVSLAEAHSEEVEISIPKNIIFYQKRSEFEKSLKGTDSLKTITGEPSNDIYYTLETFSNVFGEHNPQDSGSNYVIEGIKGNDVKEIIVMTINQDLTMETGSNSYQTREERSLNEHIKYKSRDDTSIDFDFQSYVLETIIPGQTCFKAPKRDCGIGIFKQSVETYNDPLRAKTTFNVDGRMEVKTRESGKDKILSKCYLCSYQTLHCVKTWEERKGRLATKNEIKIIKKL